MERWLNEKIQESIHGLNKCKLLNPYSGGGWTNEEERRKRLNYRTSEANEKLDDIVDAVMKEL